MEITAKMVKDLREKTGVGMMDCKHALQESNGDMEAAVDWLRKKGLAKAAKRADRATASGVFGICIGGTGKKIACLELNCETDFVAKNQEFIKLANDLAAHVCKTGATDWNTLSAERFTLDASKTVGDLLAEYLAKIGESIRVGKIAVWQAENDDATLGLYVHTGATAIGLSELTGTTGKDLGELGKWLGMQIVAARPTYLTPEDVPADVKSKEMEIYREEAKTSGKPEKIWERIAEGKLSKFYEENCLIKQAYVKDPEGKQTIEGLLKESKVGLKRFLRLSIG